MPEEKQDKPEATIQFHVPPDLEYVYRDIFNVYVGAGEVVVEMGIRHRSMPQHVSITNRVVMSVGSAYTLIQTLNQALAQAQQKLQESLRKQQP